MDIQQANRLEGLCPSPEPVNIYVDLGKDADGRVYPWHLYDRLSDKQIPIYQPAILGKLTGIRMKKAVFQDKENIKLDIRIQSGARTWVVRTGVETVFARGILQGLKAVASEGRLDEELKLYAQAGETTVMGNIYDAQNTRFQAEWDPQEKLLPVINSLQAAIGVETQTLDQVRAEYEEQQQRNRR